MDGAPERLWRFGRLAGRLSHGGVNRCNQVGGKAIRRFTAVRGELLGGQSYFGYVGRWRRILTYAEPLRTLTIPREQPM